MLVIGIDFDNTIVCYDPLFFRAARDRELIPAEFPPTKESIRDHLRATQREDQWTELQALVYGDYIQYAAPFPGVADFLSEFVEQGHQLVIVSHKTKRPYRGPDLDLRAAATRWLEAQQFLAPAEYGLPRDCLFFEATKRAKMARIAECHCDLFVDDLPEFLADPMFPKGVHRILFDPTHRARRGLPFTQCQSWSEITLLVEEWAAR